MRCLPSGGRGRASGFTLDGKRQWLAIGVGVAPEAARKAAMAHAGASPREPKSGERTREARRQKALAARGRATFSTAIVKARVNGLRTRRRSDVDARSTREAGDRRRPVDALRRLEIVELLDTIADDTGKRTGDKVLSVLRSAFTWHAFATIAFARPSCPA